MLKKFIGAMLLASLLIGCSQKYPPRSGGRTGAEWGEVLQQPDVEFRRKAAKQLGPLILTDKDALPALLIALKDDDAEVRKRAVWGLGTYSGDSKAAEVLPLLRELQQREKDAAVLETTAQAIAKLAKTPGRP